MACFGPDRWRRQGADYVIRHTPARCGDRPIYARVRGTSTTEEEPLGCCAELQIFERPELIMWFPACPAWSLSACGLRKSDAIRGWWWSVRAGQGQTRSCSDTSGGVVRPGRAGRQDRPAAAGVNQRGLHLAAPMACPGRGWTGVERTGRVVVPAGPAASGSAGQGAGTGTGHARFGEDQRWTLARVADLIARMFHTRYTLRGVSYLLHRMGFSPQVPAHRAIEHDEHAIATWRREAWPAGNGSGGAGRLAVFRRRGRANAPSVESPHLGPAWPDTSGRGVGQGFGPDLDRRAGVCSARAAQPVDLSCPHPPRPHPPRPRR